MHAGMCGSNRFSIISVLNVHRLFAIMLSFLVILGSTSGKGKIGDLNVKSHRHKVLVHITVLLIAQRLEHWYNVFDTKQFPGNCDAT